MTPTETALVLLLSFSSGMGGWAIGHAGVKAAAVKATPPPKVTPEGWVSPDYWRQPVPSAVLCPPCPAIVSQPRAPACGQHARFDPVELEYHKARLAAGVFSRIEPE